MRPTAHTLIRASQSIYPLRAQQREINNLGKRFKLVTLPAPTGMRFLNITETRCFVPPHLQTVKDGNTELAHAHDRKAFRAFHLDHAPVSDHRKQSLLMETHCYCGLADTLTSPPVLP